MGVDDHEPCLNRRGRLIYPGDVGCGHTRLLTASPSEPVVAPMSRRKATFTHYLSYVVWHLVSAILWIMPRRTVVILADFLAFLLHRVTRIRRKEVYGNLQLALGDTHSPEEISRIARDSYRNGVLTFLEFIRPHALFWEVVGIFRGFDGWDQFEAMGDKPYIIVTGHMGNWESLGEIGIRKAGIPHFVAFMKPMHNPLVNDSIVKQRMKIGLELISTSAGSFKAAVTAAREKKILVFLADQDARRNGIFVDFFGTPASTAEGAAMFAHRLNLPLLCTFSIRNNDALRTLRIEIAPAIFPDPTTERDADVLRLTQTHAKYLEDVVRRHPGSYFWLHRRWKTRPKNKRQKSVDE